MADIHELAAFVPVDFDRPRVPLEQKITESSGLIRATLPKDSTVGQDLTPDNFRNGIIPRLSPYDMEYLPTDAQLLPMPEDVVEGEAEEGGEKKRGLREERSHDLIRWNLPSQVLYRMSVAQTPFRAPIEGKSHVMDRLAADGIVVSFDDLRSESPIPNNGRQSRSDINSKIETNIMGQGRIPFALGSVPDVGSFLSYTTMAMANGMAFVSRDKVLSDVIEQATLIGDVISYLQTVELPNELTPVEDELEQFRQLLGEGWESTEADALRIEYFKRLRDSWVANVGAAIEAEPDRALKRAEALYKKGCKLFRIYSPEGGMEIIDTAKALRARFAEDSEVKIVGGQIMDLKTAQKAEAAGCDAIIIGVAGGSQCTTSVNADIPVNAPNLLYKLRGRVEIPVGIEGGGVGTHLETAFTLGASFVSKPGEIGVSWEGAGGKYMFQDRNGELYMPYGGEASVSAKWWKDSVDTFGRPKFVEGETNVRRVTRDRLSMTRNIHRLREGISVGHVFQRANVIAELHARPCDNIVQVTPDAGAKSKAYGQ